MGCHAPLSQIAGMRWIRVHAVGASLWSQWGPISPCVCYQHRWVGTGSQRTTTTLSSGPSVRGKKKKRDSSDRLASRIPQKARQPSGTPTVLNTYCSGDPNCVLDDVALTAGVVPGLASQPSEEDYRALLLDLILYRKDSLMPVVHALQQEREVLQAQVREAHKKVHELAEIRDEIRSLLQSQKEEQLAQMSRLLECVRGHERSPVTEVSSNASDTFEATEILL